MLVLTEKATEVIRTLIESPDTPDESGLRISSPPGAEDTKNLKVTWAEGPEEGDHVIEEDGARVLLEADAKRVLDDKVLDARVDQGGGVQFLVKDQ